MAWVVVSIILGFIFRGFFGWIFGILSWLINIGLLVIHILGIINAVNGKMEPLPVIGKYEIIK